MSIRSVLPGRTLATVFLADYGPGSTLEYHEFGLQPALVRFRGVTAAWNSLLLVDSPDSVRGGQRLGFNKQLAEFDWKEADPGHRASGECAVRLGDQDVVRFEIGVRHVQNDPGPSLDGPGRDRQPDQRAGRHIVATVRPGDGLAIRGEHSGRRERLI